MPDVARFTGLYERYYQSVWAYVVRRIPAGGDPGDVVAEVFATAWRRLDGVPAEKVAVTAQGGEFAFAFGNMAR